MNKNFLKIATEYGPLIGFFIAYSFSNLLYATAILVILTLVALGANLIIERKVPMMPLITAVIVTFFGGLTLWFNDETFIKMKPTIIQLIFAAILFFSLFFKKPILQKLLGHAWKMSEEGWAKLTRNFALFFVSMAFLNEVVWRTQSTDFWVNFKVFGLMIITFIFIMSQTFLLHKYHMENGTSND